MDCCIFCGRDPYARVDVGFGEPGMAVGVDCCEHGVSLYGKGVELTAVVQEFATDMIEENNELIANNKAIRTALRTLITAAKSMPENPYTPSQMALDDAVEAAEEVMKEVE